MLKFCSPSLLPGGHVEWYLKLVPDKLAWLAGLVTATKTRDPYPRLWILWRLQPPEASCSASLCPRKGERTVAGRGDLG